MASEAIVIEELGVELANAAWDQDCGAVKAVAVGRCYDWSGRAGGDPRDWEMTAEDYEWLRDQLEAGGEISDEEWADAQERAETGYRDRCTDLARLAEDEADQRRAVEEARAE